MVLNQFDQLCGILKFILFHYIDASLHHLVGHRQATSDSRTCSQNNLTEFEFYLHTTILTYNCAHFSFSSTFQSLILAELRFNYQS